MTIIRTDTNQTWDVDGNLISEETVEVDITATTNQAAIVTNLQQDMVAIQAMLDATNATINANPASFLKPIGRMLRRLGREALNDFTGST